MTLSESSDEVLRFSNSSEEHHELQKADRLASQQKATVNDVSEGDIPASGVKNASDQIFANASSSTSKKSEDSNKILIEESKQDDETIVEKTGNCDSTLMNFSKQNKRSAKYLRRFT